jgi:hypothetical protein
MTKTKKKYFVNSFFSKWFFSIFEYLIVTDHSHLSDQSSPRFYSSLPLYLDLRNLEYMLKKTFFSVLMLWGNLKFGVNAVVAHPILLRSSLTHKLAKQKIN